MIKAQQQVGPGAMPVPYLSTIVGKAISLVSFNGKSDARRFCLDLPIGLAVLILCIIAGDQLKVWLHLVIPGNLLGLFILLLCFRLGLIQPQLVEEAANRLLYIMPALFIPLFVSAISQGELWSKLGWVVLPALLVATAGLWVFVGHLAQYLLRRSSEDE